MLGISCFREKMISPEPWPEPKDCSLSEKNNSPPLEDVKSSPQSVRVCGLIDGRNIIIE
jgi:hypothetical protein